MSRVEFYNADSPTGDTFSKDDWITERGHAIIEDDLRKRDRRHAASVAHQAEMESLRTELGQAQFEQGQLTGPDVRVRDVKAIARVEKRIEKLKAKIAARQAAYDEDGQKRGGSLWNQIELWKTHDLKGPTKDRGTTDAAIDGKSALEMMNLCASKVLECRAVRKSYERRPLPRSDIEARVKKDIAALAKPINFEDVKRIRAMTTPRGGFAQGRLTVPKEFRGGIEMPDALGFIVTLLQDELTARAIDIALRDFDDVDALSTHQREKALAEIDAQTLDWEYRAAFWHREIEKTGHEVPHVTTNIWAVLDLVPM